MVKRGIIFLLIISGITCSPLLYSQEAIKGIFDLRSVKDPERLSVNLNGEWEFYWNKMLRPADFRKTPHPLPDIYGMVPSYWTAYKGEVSTSGRGYATYRLKVLLPQGLKNKLALDIPVFDSAFDLWINDSLMFYNGSPGTDEESTVPLYRRGFKAYIPKTDTLCVIINVSNFHHRRGGFWLPLKIGNFNSIQKGRAAKYAGDYATVSLVAGFAVFFLIFFFLYPKDRSHGFFGISLLGIALRPLFTSNFLIYDFIDVSWAWTVRFEYLSLYLIIIGWIWFSENQYPSRFIRYFAWGLTVLFGSAFILTMFLPVRIFGNIILLIYPALIILAIYSVICSFSEVLKKKKLELVYLAAFLLLSLGAVHDMIVSMGKSTSSLGYIMSTVVIMFIFIQAVLLLYKWVFAYYEKEKLQLQLEFMNRNLEELIKNRTRELQIRSEEIEAQNLKIAMQNKQLSDTIQLKNKIFSVISHDLRGPVVNILYMLNLLKEKEYKEKYDSFANSSIQYAQMVINLLENMLVWGRGQEDKIKYSPAHHDLAPVILTNLSIFKETADRKEISVNFTQKGNSVGFFDKDLIDIVIRNLLSNAVKYSYRGGRISILVKDKAGDGDGIMLKICDNGMGIPDSKKKYLFSISEIESTPGTENEKGTGLGLKLCHDLVKLNHGTITVESKEGEGACFIIILPLEKV